MTEKRRKISKVKILRLLVLVACVVLLVRCVSTCGGSTGSEPSSNDSVGTSSDSEASAPVAPSSEPTAAAVPEDSSLQVSADSLDSCLLASRFFNSDGTEARHRIFSVPHFGNTFPDQNDVQLLAAQRCGVRVVNNRKEAEQRKSELVYVGCNPFFYVDRLNNSIPYLVPRASVLLQDIGRAYFDSLQIKGIPLHKIIVTSILRTQEDVERLRLRNSNATQNSCHLYGTTFDVCYNRYKPVETAAQPRRTVRNDSLKWVLSEVLRDMRESGRCLVKYEVKQGCFHITVK